MPGAVLPVAKPSKYSLRPPNSVGAIVQIVVKTGLKKPHIVRWSLAKRFCF